MWAFPFTCRTVFSAVSFSVSSLRGIVRSVRCIHPFDHIPKGRAAADRFDRVNERGQCLPVCLPQWEDAGLFHDEFLCQWLLGISVGYDHRLLETGIAPQAS